MPIEIGGEVAAMIKVKDALRAVPRVEQVSDLHCVTTWSVRGLKWSGWRFRDFFEMIVLPLAQPNPRLGLSS